MKKLYGLFTVALTLLSLASVALADSFPQEAAPGNIEPEIFLIDKFFDMCADNYWGGSRPDGFDSQTSGCMDLGLPRTQQYAFTGEQVMELVVVRDLNGAPDLSYAKVTVDGKTEALCNELEVKSNETGYYVKPTGLNGVYLPSDVPPAKGMAPKGYDPLFDKVYECVWTVEPSWYGPSVVNIEAYDQEGAVSTMGISQDWFFNPAIMIDLDTNDGAPSIWYESGVPGQTVYSGNQLVVTNMAEGAVDLFAWIAADDLTDPAHSGAKCPVSNVLDVDQYMEYRGKIGTTFGDWTQIHNKDNSRGVVGHTLMGATPLAEGGTWPYSGILHNMHSGEVAFRLTYPVPCIGSFTEGMIHVIVRAI